MSRVSLLLYRLPELVAAPHDDTVYVVEGEKDADNLAKDNSELKGKLDGVAIRVYSVAKSVADCFKFRDIVGLALALEALRRSRRKGLATTQDLRHYAQVCRVTSVMGPYLDR